MWRAAIALAVVLFVGCGDDFAREYPTKPNQAAAMRLAADIIGVRTVPPVEWFEGDQLIKCPAGGTGFVHHFQEIDGCVGGWTSPGLIQSAWLDGMTFATSPAIHELGHAALIEAGGNGEDPTGDHENSHGPVWGPDGTIAQARAALAAAGL